MLILDTLYAVKVGTRYLSNLHPIQYTTSLKKARTYSTMGPARAMKTKYINKLVSCSRDTVLYLPFPYITEYGIVEIKKNIN